MYKEGLSIHKNGFSMTLANLPFAPIVLCIGSMGRRKSIY